MWTRCASSLAANTLWHRKLALETLPGLDERLLGMYVTVRSLAENREACDASFIEIETYARQIMEQLALALGPTAASAAPAVIPQKAYDVAAIRREHNQAYAPWSARDDEYQRSRFLEGATIDDLVSEFGRQPGGIRSRLRKLGLDVEGRAARPGVDGSSRLTHRCT
jgi:hypothetical protein